METTKLSSKGQIIIPKAIRDAHGWRTGTEFTIEQTRDGVMLKPRRRFPETRIEDVFGCLKPYYDGPPISVEEMNEAIVEEAKRRDRRSRRK